MSGIDYAITSLGARLVLWATGAVIVAMLADELVRDWLMPRWKGRP